MTPPKAKADDTSPQPTDVIALDEAETIALPDGRTLKRDTFATLLARLRAPFPLDEVEKLPKALRRNDQDRYACRQGTQASADGHYCGGFHVRSMHLDYVGHAGITERLLDVDPFWSWEAVRTDEHGIPVPDQAGGLWIRLTVLGITRLGYGDAAGKSGPNATKELIGDAIRNAAMRFGVATYLWSKSDRAMNLKRAEENVTDVEPERPRQQAQRPAQRPQGTRPSPAPTEERSAPQEAAPAAPPHDLAHTVHDALTVRHVDLLGSVYHHATANGYAAQNVVEHVLPAELPLLGLEGTTQLPLGAFLMAVKTHLESTGIPLRQPREGASAAVLASAGQTAPTAPVEADPEQEAQVEEPPFEAVEPGEPDPWANYPGA